MQFPLIGSCVLFGLYVVVKFVKKEYLDALISVYFAALGCFGLFSAFRAPANHVAGGAGLKRFAFSIHWKLWKRRDAEDAGAPRRGRAAVAAPWRARAGAASVGTGDVNRARATRARAAGRRALTPTAALPVGFRSAEPRLQSGGRGAGGGERVHVAGVFVLEDVVAQQLPRLRLLDPGHPDDLAGLVCHRLPAAGRPLLLRRLLGLRHRGDGRRGQGAQRADQDHVPKGARRQAAAVLHAGAGRHRHPGAREPRDRATRLGRMGARTATRVRAMVQGRSGASPPRRASLWR